MARHFLRGILSDEINKDPLRDSRDTRMGKRDREDVDANSAKKQDVGRPPSPDSNLLPSVQVLGPWEQHISSKTGKPYWFNTLTGQTQWTFPCVFPPKSPPLESAGEPGIIGPLEGPKGQGHYGQHASSESINIGSDSNSSINYPKRPGQQRCTYYLTHGVCKFGESCKFDHPTDR